MISWNPPYTLPGVPILGYNVNITNIDFDMTKASFISNTQITLSLDYNYIVSIAGVNGAGVGHKSIINVTSFLNGLCKGIKKVISAVSYAF